MFRFLRKAVSFVFGLTSKADKYLGYVTKYRPIFESVWWAVEQLGELAGWTGPAKASHKAAEYRDRLKAIGLTEDAVRAGIEYAEGKARQAKEAVRQAEDFKAAVTTAWRDVLK